MCPVIPPAGIVGVLLSRCRTDAASETVRGGATANGSRGYPPCAPANLKPGGYDKSDLYGILISPPTAGKTVGHFEYSKSA